MTNPIKLDLRDLDKAKLEAAMEVQHESSCEYQAPCIIGSLMTEEERTHCDNQEVQAIGSLEYRGHVKFKRKDQVRLATRLQEGFDNALPSIFLCNHYADFTEALLRVTKLEGSKLTEEDVHEVMDKYE